MNIKEYFLEKRLRKLEKLVNEATDSSTGLFSSDINEVEAAIDEGQDVNQLNDKGQTPLVVACSSKSASSTEIVKLLLDNGADPNIKTKRILALGAAIKAKNIENILALIDAGAKTVWGPNSRDSKIAYEEALKSKIFNINVLSALILNDDTLEPRKIKYCLFNILYSILTYVDNIGTNNYIKLCKAIYNKVLQHITPEEAFIKQSNIASTEIEKHITVTVDEMMRYNIFHVFTEMNTWQIDKWDDESKRLYLNYATKAIQSQCKMFNPNVVEHTIKRIKDYFNKANASIDDYTPEYINSLSQNAVVTIIADAIRLNRSDILKAVINAQRSDLNADNIISNVYNSSQKFEPKISNLICKIIANTTAYKKHELGFAAQMAAQKDDELLINWFLDAGYRDAMLDARITSATFERIVADNGYIKPFQDDPRITSRNLIDITKRYIKNDFMIREIIQTIEANPDVLDDPGIKMLLNSYDNITTRQLKAIINKNKRGQINQATADYDF